MTSTVLIVGGTGYFGKAIAKELSLSGHNVVCMPRFDITDEKEVDLFFKENKQNFNHLVYSVGSSIQFKKIYDEDPSSFREQFDVQIKGLLMTVKHVTLQNDFKSVLVIGSSSVFGVPPVRLASYTTAKHALLGFVRSLAAELAGRNIRVNMISPGLTGTGLSKEYPDALLRLTASQTPFKRLVTDEDVAKVAKFLISEDSSYLTGLNIPVDGGLHMS